jgi:hypothetical protein
MVFFWTSVVQESDPFWQDPSSNPNKISDSVPLSYFRNNCILSKIKHARNVKEKKTYFHSASETFCPVLIGNQCKELLGSIYLKYCSMITNPYSI